MDQEARNSPVLSLRHLSSDKFPLPLIAHETFFLHPKFYFFFYHFLSSSSFLFPSVYFKCSWSFFDAHLSVHRLAFPTHIYACAHIYTGTIGKGIYETFEEEEIRRYNMRQLVVLAQLLVSTNPV